MLRHVSFIYSQGGLCVSDQTWSWRGVPNMYVIDWQVIARIMHRQIPLSVWKISLFTAMRWPINLSKPINSDSLANLDVFIVRKKIACTMTVILICQMKLLTNSLACFGEFTIYNHNVILCTFDISQSYITRWCAQCHNYNHKAPIRPCTHDRNLTLPGEQWGVFRGLFEEKWPRCIESAL